MAAAVPGISVEERPRAGAGSHPPGWEGGRPGDFGGNRQGGSNDLRSRLTRYRIGLVVGLISVAMLFVSITSAYVVRQGVATWDEAKAGYVLDWQRMNVPPILWWNTVLLIVSSLTVELARQKAFRPRLPAKIAADGTPIEGRSVPWLGITIVLGMGFLVGQYVAWVQLHSQGIFLSSNPSSSFFYLLTAAHGLHLAGGMLALLWASLSMVFARSPESRLITLDVTAWYWHFMALLWVYILGLLYFVS